MKKALIVIFIVILVLAVAGLLVHQYFAGQTTDGPVMEDPAAPMLELLSARWTSEDGLWEAQIEGYTLELRHRQEPVYSGSFTFDFHGDDINARTELVCEDRRASGTPENLWVENGRLYLNITETNGGEDSVRQQVVLKRAEPGEQEPEEIREVSEMAELVEFTWDQNAMSYDACFQFWIKTTQKDLSDPRLYCRYTNPETYERVEIGDDDPVGFQGFGLGGTRLAENETWLPVSPKRWAELADFLRRAELSAYQAPPPGLLDATSSIIAVTWRENGEEFTNRYGGGTSARDLLKLLQDIAGEVSGG